LAGLKRTTTHSENAGHNIPLYSSAAVIACPFVLHGLSETARRESILLVSVSSSFSFVDQDVMTTFTPWSLFASLWFHAFESLIWIRQFCLKRRCWWRSYPTIALLFFLSFPFISCKTDLLGESGTAGSRDRWAMLTSCTV